MRNLLLYVEENLLYSSDQCYTNETDTFNSNNGSVEVTYNNAPLISPQSILEDKTSNNAPLISPQSTLEDKTSGTPPLISPQSILEGKLVNPSLQHILPNDSQKLEDNLGNQASKTNPFAHLNPLTRNTNPFLQDVSIYDQNKEISPEKVLRLWNENLKLQIQISAIFEILFNKVMKSSDAKVNDTPMNNNLKIRDTISHINNNISLMSANRLNIDDSNIYPFNNDLQRVGDSTEEVSNYDLNFNNYIDFIEHSLKKLNLIHSKILLPASSDSNIVSQPLPKNEISVNRNVPPGFENFFNAKTGLPETLEEPINLNTPLKETNPFKTGLLNKLRESDPQKGNCFNFDDLSISTKNQKIPTKHDLISFEEDNTAVLNVNLDVAEKVCGDVPYNYHQDYSSCDSGNTDDTNTKLPKLDAKFVSTDYVKTMDTIKNTENIIINSPTTIHNVNELNTKKHVESENSNPSNFQNCNNDAYIYTPSYLRMVSQEHVIEQKKEDNVILESSHLLLENDRTPSKVSIKNRTTTSWLPINSFTTPLPTIQDNTYIDEGYLTRSSTSHSSDKMSPSTQTINNINQYGASSHIWTTAVIDKNSIQPINWDKMYLQSMNNEDVKITCNQNQCINDVESQEATDNVGTKNTYVDLSKLKNIWDTTVPREPIYFSENYSTPIHTSLPHKIYLLVIELRERLVHIFHYQSQGWLVMNEFVLFTEFKTVPYMLYILKMLNIEVPLLNVDRTKCSIEYVELRSDLRQETKDIMYNHKNLQLLPIKGALKLLTKLEMISMREVNEILMNNEFVSGSIAEEIWMITHAYGRMKYIIENRGAP